MARSGGIEGVAGDAAAARSAPQCCLVCGRTLTDRAQHDELEGRVLASIRSEHPEWAGGDGGCERCVARYRELLRERLTREERLRELSSRRPAWLERLARRLRFEGKVDGSAKRVSRNGGVMKGWKIALLVAVTAVVGAAFAGCSSAGPRQDARAAASAPGASGGPPSGRVGTSVGDTAPDFRLAGLDGTEVGLDDLKGQPAVLIFWTAWCPVCKEEAPHFNELAARYEPQGVRVLGVNIMDSQARAEGGVKDFGIRYKVVRDPDAGVTRRYKVAGTPTVVFLDRDGVVRYFGNELPADYASRLDALIARKG